MLRLIYPPKCVLCGKLLPSEVTDLCHDCRKDAPEFTRAKRNIPFIAQWRAIWYYKDTVRKSIHRFKFGNRRSYAETYARLMAVDLQDNLLEKADIITWVPVSFLRKFRRGYDQSALVANALAKESGLNCAPLLKKIRHTPPQSGIRTAEARRANVQGAYKPVRKTPFAGKRILLIDDVVTTGATASECAKTLLLAGAKEVYFAAVVAAFDQ